MLAKYGDPKRFEILTLIASILKLSEDERVKLGLIRQPGVSVSPRNSVSRVSPAEVLPLINWFTLYSFRILWICGLRFYKLKPLERMTSSLR